VEPGHFSSWSLGARFYPVLYLLTRMGAARDWGSGLPLKASLLGQMNRLEVHHIFPKAQLYRKGYKRPEVNALANFCFLTKDTNLQISDTRPEAYFEKIEANHPGALASQWIPMDRALWRIDRYRDFLEARRALLAEETNRRLAELLHGEAHWLEGRAMLAVVTPETAAPETGAGPDEEEEIEAVNDWLEDLGLPRGEVAFDHADPATGEPLAVFDVVWPRGLQEGLSQPVALLLNEPPSVLELASAAGFRCFVSVREFRQYVEAEVLAEA
jgi:hypothetical protein